MSFSTALIQLPLVRERPLKRVVTPEDAYETCKDLGELAQEVFLVLSLDTKNRLIERGLVTVGIIDASLVHPREVFRQAIQSSAAAVVLVHNHPSGDPTPSAEDIRITRQLIVGGRIIDIRVLDHVVVGRPLDGRPGFMSMRESGVCDFS
jgi:DNA repair protein RadC